MIPPVETREVVSSGVDDSTSFDISKDDVAHIMTILRDTLYSDKIMAVLREYSTNAWDANRMAGRPDVPIEVTMPTLGVPELVIRDRGPGLSHDDIRRVYTQYGASTKRESNVAAGMLGIGSKSGFAYSDSFTITSWHGGKKRIYVAVLNDERGRCDLIHAEPCDEADTGVEIKIAVKPQDIGNFEQRAKKLYQHFSPRPKINLSLDAEYLGREIPGFGHIDERDGWEFRGKWFAVMGPVAYAIDLGQLSGEAGGERLGNAAHNLGGFLPFDIGILQVAASREGLKYGDPTRAALIKRINGIIDEYVRQMFTDFDKLSKWERRLRTLTVERKRLPVPLKFNDFSKGYIDMKPKSAFTVAKRNYNGRLAHAGYVDVVPEARFVIRDDKRAQAGFKLKGQDMVVSPAMGYESSLKKVREELEAMIAEIGVDGIPITYLSQIEWVKPEGKNGPAKPRDAARAKARSFLLDPSKPFHDDERSQLWTIVDRVPQDTDVFVVLESYRVFGMEGFYETYRQDEDMLKRVGLKMPSIYGYKSTKAKPVLGSSLKGVDYRKWRVGGMVKMLMGVPDVAVLVQASAYDTSNSAMDATHIVSKLDADHPLAQFAAAEQGSKMAWSKATNDAKMAATHAKNSLKSEELDAVRLERGMIEKYPLLRTNGLNVFRTSSVTRDLWLDYIKLVDSVGAQQAKEQQEEAA